MLRTRLTPAGFVAPCQPTPVQPPIGADWLHEIKHDGFRLMVYRAGARVRLFIRNGSFLIDGEAVVADARGRRVVQPAARPCTRNAGVPVGVRPA